MGKAIVGFLRRGYMRLTSLSIPWNGAAWYTRLLYFLWSLFYDLSVGLDPGFRTNAKRLVDRTVDRGDRVLDVGVGTGILAEYAAERAADYVGIDYSPSMLARAARKLGARRLQNVSLRWGDARTLPFANDSFDTVLSSFVLPHFPDEEKGPVLKEMARVLRPGGVLGLFLARGEIAPLFSSREQLDAWLSEAHLVESEIRDRDDVYRIITAHKPASMQG